MKKHISMITAIMITAAVLTGCGASGRTAPIGAPTAALTEAVAAAAEAEAETTAAETGATTRAAQVTSEETEILVTAAASLKSAYEEKLVPMFQGKCPGVAVKGTYDSSGRLQTQIEEGLETGAFMSAAVKQMTALDEEGIIASDTITDLLESKIVLTVPTEGDSKLAKFEDIENAGSIALEDPTSIPAGQYTEETLANLRIWDRVRDKVNLGTNMMEVLNQMAATSADAGIVYATDAASMADKVEVVAETPEGSLAKKIIYPMAVVKNTAHEEQAKGFVEFLKIDEAMRVFEAYGFTRGE